MKRTFYAWLFPLLVFLAACNSGKLKLDSKNFEEEFDLQQNLVFNFNQDLVGDSVLNNWIDTGYIKFTPEVKGRFRWTSKDELVFSPSLGFLPSTEYKIDVTDKVMMHSAKKYSLSDASFTAHTPWLSIVSGNSFWSLNESNRSQIELRTELYFNSKINVQDIKSLITVEIDGKAVACQVIGTGISDKALVTVPESDSKFDDKKMRVIIKPGLKCAESEYKTKENLLFETVIANKTNFQAIQMEGTYEEDKAVINVSTNQEPAEQNIEGLITITPSLNFDVEKNGSGFFIRGAFQEGTAYKVIVRKELKGIFGGTLKENFERDVTFGAQEPHISFTSKKGVYLSSKGDKNVGLKIINVPNVRVQIYKIYENNIIQFLKNNFYSYSDYEEDYYDYGG
jgi:alpha-2-macroglobulin